MKGLGISAVVLSCAVTAGLAVAQTTRPAGPGGAKKPVRPADRDSVLVKDDAHHYEIAVPKAWKPLQKTNEFAAYELASSPRDPGMPGVVMFNFNKMCHPGATLEEEVDANKKLLADRVKGYKLIREEKSDLGGVPASVLTYEHTYDWTAQPNPKSPKTKAGQRKARDITVICLNHDEAYMVDLDIDAGTFDGKVPQFKRALTTLTWTGPAATSDADAKK